jgi:hypothetical protein
VNESENSEINNHSDFSKFQILENVRIKYTSALLGERETFAKNA